ncbi:MAG: TIM barrel protein [Firmicutes bacterium]|nr:TIM barrel protein [Bacillota bacterium]
MKVGLNLSFAVKRWLEPEQLAFMVRNDFKTKYVQFTWDLLNPWWPSGQRDKMARNWSKAFAREEIILDGTFGGLASYTYPQLMARTTEERKISLEFFKRAIDMTVALGAKSIGTPLGGMTHNDAYNKTRRQEIYQIVLGHIRELAIYAKQSGLEKIIIEPTPLYTEFPSDPESTLKLMQDLEGTTDIPVRVLVDWGHALFKPLLKNKADMDLWLKTCQNYIECFHLQQTDGQLDRHWDFTKQGIISLELIKEITEKNKVSDLIQYLEVIYAFEETDEDVYQNLKKTMDLLHGSLE